MAATEGRRRGHGRIHAVVPVRPGHRRRARLGPDRTPEWYGRPGRRPSRQGLKARDATTITSPEGPGAVRFRARGCGMQPDFEPGIEPGANQGGPDKPGRHDQKAFAAALLRAPPPPAVASDLAQRLPPATVSSTLWWPRWP